MANTGIATYLNHKRRKKYSAFNLTGEIKANVVGDVDYISSGIRLDLCPVSYNTNCVTEYGFTFTTNQLRYELTLPFSVYNNPAVAKVRVTLLNSGTPTGTPQIFILASMTNNFFSGIFTGLSAGTYTIRVNYLDTSDVVLGVNCNLS